MDNLSFSDNAGRTICLQDGILSVSKNGMTIVSDRVENYIILYYDEKNMFGAGHFVIQLPQKDAIDFGFRCGQRDDFNRLYSNMVGVCKINSKNFFAACSSKDDTKQKSKENQRNIERERQERLVCNVVKDDNQAKCPRCGSTSLSANKKGFGMGKAVVGTLAFGVIGGALAGSIGAKKIEVTCLKCGKKFKV